VYVHGGSIVPIEPLTQSTEETPKGPLTLRVYPATDRTTPCTGEVYADDGHSFNFRQGDYARVNFSCALRQDGSMTFTVAPQQGRFHPWWTEYRLEIYGWSPTRHTAFTGSSKLPLTAAGSAWTVSFPAKPSGGTVQIQ